GLRNAKRRLDGLKVAHLAYEYDVGIFAKRGPESRSERMRVRMDFALIHYAVFVRMQKLDRIFNCNYVLVPILIHFVDHCGERRRLSRTRRAGNQNQPARLVAKLLYYRRQTESFEALNLIWNGAKYCAHRSALIEEVGAETRQSFNTEREVEFEGLLKS